MLLPYPHQRFWLVIGGPQAWASRSTRVQAGLRSSLFILNELFWFYDDLSKEWRFREICLLMSELSRCMNSPCSFFYKQFCGQKMWVASWVLRKFSWLPILVLTPSTTMKPWQAFFFLASITSRASSEGTHHLERFPWCQISFQYKTG